ncbi:MAG: hypothetical protein A3F31_04470 [Candidatus Levybacteria bacterium RIFCSPHIGHO2_12_FULL_38_12]|nr:MAG: hypothetical protein A2770_04155 [Candidatus Levybacteria bacterium RIFCSPHIGHO2_01_FULL_38_12]OGH21836.1 MAG: hypothetical protein A3D75_01435 [Candidatus Levybacteria bacterium RIFCSPHIGHO2_02_FULL_37_18]OGH22507.1 MAG: hypothetical protein A3F31_04470 [Candidatus Levybacteria bacterium RIFCSPHIGHO2_12_FULL_38_12]OGH33457.1 MAG: hypothetical protein A3A47_04385 [Candidatus Levybacteria bacterium RIFCSPLOWO2_01_FULL_37_20]OGH44044.1 MAG: hypothetical protein A3J14_04840 [Candidatus Lev
MNKGRFKQVSPHVDFPKLEEEILKFWKENKIFEKSIKSRPKDKTWTFLDGPPFITGLPHYGSLLVSIPKDMFPRFFTMKGYRVRRVWGWDVHGLPAENKVETKLGIKSKREIEEKIGIKKFIEECRKYVSESSKEWEWYIMHIARWVDFRNAYKTMDLSYMESVMWVFKQMYDKGYIYKGLRVSLYCPHCSTPISNFEVAMDADNYKEVTDSATVYKYKLKTQSSKLKDTYILAWSTTPWNKVATPALAVNPDLLYVKVTQGDKQYILAKATLKILSKKPAYKILEEFKGRELIGKKFIPHYDYYPIAKGEKTFEIVGSDFVTADEGTGVVTIAAYGQEDLKVMQEQNIHIELHVNEEGIIKKNVPKFGGMYYLKANKAVNEDLQKRGLVYKDEKLAHSVALCWRCHTRLYYAPQDAWYVNVQKLKPRMKKTNEEVRWFPAHFKMGRFLKSLEAAPDWCISRSRYWGSPVPVWECGCKELFVPGSISELEELSGTKITDLHKPEIDEVLIKCTKCGKLAKRVPEVLDSWIEAGSASFAERHFPFNKNVKLEDFFPPDFIVEYTGQIRAWFYVLHVISAALFDSNAFKNVVVTGVILGTDGRKMSKNLGNYPDPKLLLQKYGGDALRLYLMGSPVMHGEDIIISEEQYRNQVRGMLLVVWNVYNFFVTNVNVDSWSPQTQNSKLPLRFKAGKPQNILDEWILSLLQKLIQAVTSSLESYDTVSAIEHINKFIDDLSKWFVRRSRNRVGPTAENGKDKDDAYQTLWTVLVEISKILAPFVPFISEEMYKNLTGEESVHLSYWPDTDFKNVNYQLITDMERVRFLVERAHALRKEKGIRVRQPLNTLWICGFKSVEKKRWQEYEEIIKGELNIKHIEYTYYEGLRNNPQKVEFAEGIFVDTHITSELKTEGQTRDLIRQIQEERKKLGTQLDEKVAVSLPAWPKEFEGEIKKKALVESLSVGEFIVKRL